MRFQELSIRARLLCLTLGLLVPLVLAGFSNLWEFRNNTQEQLNQSLKQQADLAAVAFEQRILAYRQTLEAIAILDENNEGALQDYLSSIIRTRPNWLDIHIVDLNGEILLSQAAPSSNLSRDTLLPLIKEASSENAFVISTEQFSGENLSLLSIARPTANGKFVIARIDGASVSEVFKNLKFPTDHIIAVFDKDNRLLYRSRVSPEQMSLDVSESPFLAALNDRREGTIDIESPYDKIRRIYGLAQVETVSALVAVGVPSATLYEPARKQFMRQLLLGSFFLFLGVAAAYAIALSITRPMNILTRAVRRFGAGVQPSYANIAGQGTIGELGATFNKMAEQISKREDELKALDRLKSDFVSSVSHELRTPLTTIKTLVRVLQGDKISAADRADYLDTIAVECDRQIGLVQNLLDLSRIESGAYRVSLAETDVLKVLSDSVEAQMGTARSHNLDLVIDPAPTVLPPAITDKDALSRIVADLIDNSIKYSREGGEVRISARLHGRRIAVEIEDDGCGIAPDDLPHIFEKFYRGKPIDRNSVIVDSNGTMDVESVSINETSGVGLGLYLVYGLVTQISAEIRVESPVPGSSSGTRFTLYLPLAPQAASSI
jgi:signal transduction histidine kinase